MKQNGGTSFNRAGTLRSQKTERAFSAQFIDRSRRIIRNAAFWISLFLLTLLLLDAFVLSPARRTSLSLSIGIFVCALGFLTALLAAVSKNSGTVSFFCFLFLMFVAVGGQAILLARGDAVFSEHTILFIVCLSAFFLAPCRWAFSFVASIVLTAAFLIAVPLLIGDIPATQFWFAALCLAASVVIGALNAYNLNAYRRTQFLRENQLRQLSSTDPLTDIRNRMAFDDVLAHWLDISDADNTIFSLIMFDLDDFRRLNDAHGHTAGDRVLAQTAELIGSSLRSDDIFARWGGEEFTVLLPHSDIEDAAMIAERLRNALEAQFRFDHGITASFGVTEYRVGDTADSLVARVDGNLFAAKQRGKNCVHCE